MAEGRRESVDVHLGSVEPLRLEEYLVTLSVGKFYDLVFDRWTVSRPASADGPTVQR